MSHRVAAVPAPAEAATNSDWPPRMRTNKAADYLNDVHGIPAQEKTMRNWRAAGRGPACKYLGTMPLYDRVELDRWAEYDALQAESPMRRNRRAATERVAPQGTATDVAQ
jgi:hypothetical protein